MAKKRIVSEDGRDKDNVSDDVVGGRVLATWMWARTRMTKRTIGCTSTSSLDRTLVAVVLTRTSSSVLAGISVGCNDENIGKENSKDKNVSKHGKDKYGDDEGD